MGTKNNPGGFDCYVNAEPDEPLFVLLGRDKHAPTLVWLWATLRELDGEDPETVKEARECVTAMLEWAHDHDRQSVGLGQATLAGVMEMVRSVNTAMRMLEEKSLAKGSDDVSVLRMFLTETRFPEE